MREWLRERGWQRWRTERRHEAQGTWLREWGRRCCCGSGGRSGDRSGGRGGNGSGCGSGGRRGGGGGGRSGHESGGRTDSRNGGRSRGGHTEAGGGPKQSAQVQGVAMDFHQAPTGRIDGSKPVAALRLLGSHFGRDG